MKKINCNFWFDWLYLELLLLNIIKKDKKNFDVVLLSANNNFNEVFKQSIEF